ncbi:M15 family metallopeptidase [Clostridium sp. YIM B02551]|uniref:M15 family metallopeptidase n=1 Tax=Clostridium sp. YIM B02551 TaxID=2910679 RepID=UPI001EEA4B97|nr:M15 family metallopeptidase [Clostridium sp. YIM B02551]
MKKIFKRFIAFVIIICGFWYMFDHIASKSKGEEVKESVLNFSKENKSETIENNDGDDKLVLVNEEHELNKNFKPKDLTIPNITFVHGTSNEERHVSDIIKEPLEGLFDAAKKDGITLLGNSGYRSYKSQENTYNNRVKTQGENIADSYVARPGSSEHQTGLCIDVTNQKQSFVKGTKEAEWLDKNCYKFGFIIRYPYGKKYITGIEYEPWHIRYVGKDAAKYIHDNGITLEEYLEK